LLFQKALILYGRDHAELLLAMTVRKYGKHIIHKNLEELNREYGKIR